MKIKFLLLFSCFALVSKVNFAQEEQAISKNNIKIIPFSSISTGPNVIADIYAGLGYDRIISKSGKLSFTSQFAYRYMSSANLSGYYYLPRVFMIGSGVKYFPWGHKKLTIGFGGILNYENYKYGIRGFSYDPSLIRYNDQYFGLLTTSSLQYNISRKVNLNLEAGAGLNLMKYENIKYYYDVGEDFKPSFKPFIDLLFNVNFSVGFRF